MNNLKAIRQSKGIQREQLSRMTGIKTGTIKHWEDGSVDIKNAAFMSIIKISRALDADPIFLVGGEDS